MPSTSGVTEMPFSVPTPSLGGLFRTLYPFYVPKYQRGYAWEVEQASDFVNDIKALMPGRETHFMGGMVHVALLAPNIVSRRHEIVDGQQRMATFTLAVSAILWGLRKLSTETVNADISASCQVWIEEIGETILYSKEARGTQRIKVPKLELSRTDEPYFRALVNGQSTAATRASHQRLQEAYDIIMRALVSPILDGPGTESEKRDSLVELYRTMADRCIVIHIATHNRQDAYRLFSVLNDRGRNLTVGDLLRAHTLELLEPDLSVQEAIEEKWDYILDESAEDTDKYFKTFFPSKTGRRAPSNELYDTYQQEFLRTTSIPATRDFVLELAQDKPAFTAIRQGLWPFGDASEASLWDRDRLHRLVNILRHEAAHPLILSAVKLGERKFVEVIRLLERFVFRYITIVGAHPSPLYRPYYAEAKRMRERPATYRVQDLQSELAALISTRAPDSAFRSGLVLKLQYSDNTARNREIRHFLSTLESYRRWYERLPTSRNRPRPDTMHVFDVTASTLEHIYPNNPPAGQQDPAMEPLKQGLANLTIMAEGDNGVNSNDPFSVKRSEYADSSVGLTHRLASFSQWTPAEFQIREGELLQMAREIFSIS